MSAFDQALAEVAEPQKSAGEAIPFAEFAGLSDEACQERIVAARTKLGSEAVILCHHYQRADVYRHADLTGDSLKLARLAAQTDARYIVFCGVHFMAEVADILSKPQQVAILPDLSAGCSMADMADLPKVTRAWRELGEVLGDDPEQTYTPVTYINSAADLKAFCGQHGGIVCTSTNAPQIVDWALKERPKLLFFPDQHLGRWTGYKRGIALEKMKVWDPDLPYGGLTPEAIRDAEILLWKGHCSVHQMFTPQQIDRWKAKYPDGFVIAHPECSLEVCLKSDYVGSTEFIQKTIREAPRGTKWLVGTELNLVSRLAEEMAAEEKVVHFMGGVVCMCSTMQRIDPQHLAWTLANLANGVVVNRIQVPESVAHWARVALDRMLAVG
ncbi:quinolinate synthase NadA [Hydrogenophilus thermoluteolus]|uniref:Quinolinate synthase n=1 Tax=Hydrogenophilus thermoluteolus TaxID=297 RepID=A0A2Z6E0C1_HYDTE|nr:quinolinate synthase NadA [Hydrogenophilus thermoluteolus]HCO77449.1 quinolinate synthase [Rhodocyclaceae bacterium]MBW7656087.1 quinolinate synthase NadA [Hydrogenophilus thermoluteolus]BBD78231.1 quinolinate synthetase [Hydrogenophilus thermoluteolus]GLW61143.1 quinolinate synthase A [Hydrogenophilus thermoluteolus]HNQ49303.1 quinolinate synthase NadA [Hydrogenophilus thermoluteolus]